MPFSRSLYCSAIHYSLFHLGKINITHVLLQIDPNYYTNQTHELNWKHIHILTIHKIVEMHFTYMSISETVLKSLGLSCGSELTRFGLCKRGALHVARVLINPPHSIRSNAAEVVSLSSSPISNFQTSN